MANSNYSELSNPELVGEIKKRRESGRVIKVDLRKSDDFLIAALEADDAATPEQEEQLLGELHNQLLAPGELPVTSTVPSDEAFSKGFRARNKSDGYTYQVAEVPDDNRPFKARVPKQASGHPGLYWEGSEEEFQSNFSKL